MTEIVNAIPCNQCKTAIYIKPTMDILNALHLNSDQTWIKIDNFGPYNGVHLATSEKNGKVFIINKKWEGPSKGKGELSLHYFYAKVEEKKPEEKKPEEKKPEKPEEKKPEKVEKYEDPPPPPPPPTPVLVQPIWIGVFSAILFACLLLAISMSIQKN